MSEHKPTVMRLQQMGAKARNAAQSEVLLSHLAVFHEPFGRSAIIGLAPEGMDEPTRIAAFATLRYRCKVNLMAEPLEARSNYLRTIMRRYRDARRT